MPPAAPAPPLVAVAPSGDGALLRAAFADPNGDVCRLQVEIQPVGTPFTGTPTATGLLSTSGFTALLFDSLRPGALNPGSLGSNGEELVRAFNSQARIDIGLEMMQAKQQTINEAFFITLFQILVDNPTMTATEVLERAQEKGMLLVFNPLDQEISQTLDIPIYYTGLTDTA